MLVETPEPASWPLVAAELEHAWGLPPAAYQRVGTRYVVKQRLTHQLVHLSFERLHLPSKAQLPGWVWVPKSELGQYPFPKAIKEYVSAELLQAGGMELL